jgi:hypothetical protein
MIRPDGERVNGNGIMDWSNLSALIVSMKNISHLLKVTSAWISIVYVVCFAGVALFPGIRPGFMRYGLHTEIDGGMGQDILTLGTFISGLVIWNIVALLAVLLFASLYNRIK